MAHDPEKRATVLAVLIAGSTVAETSRETGIPEPTIIRWREEAGLTQKPPKFQTIGTEKKRDLGELVGEYLDDVLVTLRAQAVHARDQEWLTRQDAAQLAILHGVLTDKAIRLLGALQTDEPIKLPDSATA